MRLSSTPQCVCLLSHSACEPVFLSYFTKYFERIGNPSDSVLSVDQTLMSSIHTPMAGGSRSVSLAKHVETYVSKLFEGKCQLPIMERYVRCLKIMVEVSGLPEEYSDVCSEDRSF